MEHLRKLWFIQTSRMSKKDHENVEDEDGTTPAQKLIPPQLQLPSTFNVEPEKEAKQEAAAETVDHFQKLPDELVMQIIDKVCEAKWLCMLYMTSKRYAHLVTKISTVCLKVPGWTIGNETFVDEIAYPMTRCFLKKLTSVVSLHVEFILPQPGGGVKADEDGDDDEYITRWKAFGDQQVFFFFGAKRVTDAETASSMNNDGDEQKEETISAIHSKVHNHHTKDSRKRYDLLRVVVKAFPNLKTAEVTDSGKQGMLVVAAECLKKIRKRSNSRRHKPWTVIFKTLWYEDVIKLPLPSGLVIHGAAAGFFTSITVDAPLASFVSASIAKDGFVEEEFCEAASMLVQTDPYDWGMFGDFVESFTDLYDHPALTSF